jgi:muramoyltetrapeptide carboxypeptidase
MTPDTLTLFTPAGVLASAAPLRLAAKRLKALGFEVTIDESALARDQRFAGVDDFTASRRARPQSRWPRAAAMDSRGCSTASTGNCLHAASRGARGGSATAT